ncbi:zinc ribbon-containing protein [Shewanella algae]|uniref:zinc ribbon-containing protein n=1 Tax=Shewanella algae TaxID=38313 RepID=UPI001AACA3AC|nr:zinc ribbon-containing protein [Shewanella algae]QTE89846.1 zinc ribbon-containing protein [Shewanella algae]
MSERSTELLALYQALIDRVKQQYNQDNSLTVKSLFNAIKEGKEYLAIKQQAGEAELSLVEEFLKRDIASYIQSQTEDDISYSPTMLTLENTLWHWLGEISDRSQVEWHELAHEFKHHGYYQSGDIVSQGKMVCSNCGHEMDFEFPGIIPDCPECDHSEFTREALAP